MLPANLLVCFPTGLLARCAAEVNSLARRTSCITLISANSARTHCHRLYKSYTCLGPLVAILEESYPRLHAQSMQQLLLLLWLRRCCSFLCLANMLAAVDLALFLARLLRFCSRLWLLFHLCFGSEIGEEPQQPVVLQRNCRKIA